MKRKTIKISIYLGDLILIQTNDFKELELKYNLDISETYEALCFQSHTKNGYTQYFLAFSEPTIPKIIAHECLHAVAAIFRDRGINLDMYNDEHQCYLLGWLVEQCHNFLILKENKKNRNILKSGDK